MLALFWLSQIIVFYVYLGYPILLIALAFLFRLKIDKGEIFPFVSLIISIYNEENIIEEKILNSLALDYPKECLEIIVASESTDKTNAIVRKYKDQGINLVASPIREGKSATLFRVVPKVKGQILVFSDANAMYERNALKKIVNNFNDARVGCVSGHMRYEDPSRSNSGMGENLYWTFENWLRKANSGLVTGSIFGLRKECYNPISKFRGDDFELSMRCALLGYLVVFEEEALSYEKVYPTTRQEFNRKTRVAAWNFESALILIKEAILRKRVLLTFKILSHKLLRWLMPFILIILIVSNIPLLFLNSHLFYISFFLFQCFFYLIAASGYVCEKKSKKLFKIVWISYYFCMVNYAALCGVLRTLFGKNKILWNVERS